MCLFLSSSASLDFCPGHLPLTLCYRRRATYNYCSSRWSLYLDTDRINSLLGTSAPGGLLLLADLRVSCLLAALWFIPKFQLFLSHQSARTLFLSDLSYYLILWRFAYVCHITQEQQLGQALMGEGESSSDVGNRCHLTC